MPFLCFCILINTKMKNIIKSLIVEILKESDEKSWASLSKEEKLKKVLGALGNKIPKDLPEEKMESLAKEIGKEVSGNPFTPITLRRYIRDIEESSLLKEGMIPAGDIQGLVNWLEAPENWTAAANAVSLTGAGEVKDLTNFVKAHREFGDWSWEDVMNAIEQADERNLMESVYSKINKHVLKEEIQKSITDAFDRGDWDLFNTAKLEDAVENLRAKIKTTKNPRLIDVFEKMAAIEKYRKVFAQHPDVFSKNIEKAAKTGNWESLSNWFMDLAKKINDPKQLNEFFQKGNK